MSHRSGSSTRPAGVSRVPLPSQEATMETFRRLFDWESAKVSTRQQAMEIAAKARQTLKKIYDGRLRGVYLYGSAARDQLTPDSDIDIAVILDQISDRFAEHERTSQLACDLSLEYDTLVAFLFVAEADFADGTFLVYRTIKREGIRT